MIGGEEHLLSDRYVLPELGIVDQTPEQCPELTFGYHNETTDANAGESDPAHRSNHITMFIRPLVRKANRLGFPATCPTLVHVRISSAGLADRPGVP